MWHVPDEMRKDDIVANTPGGSFKAWLYFLASFMVFSGTCTGKLISALVPPDGIDCRHLGQLAILMVWVLSFALNFLLKSLPHGQQFWLVFLKDQVATFLTIFGIIITQVGIFNRCSCWTKFGQVGLSLPQDPPTLTTLEHRIKREYPLIAFGSIILQLGVFGCVWYRFRHAFRVFLQRDDGTSNLDPLRKMNPSWWPKMLDWLSRICNALRKIKPSNWWRKTLDCWLRRIRRSNYNPPGLENGRSSREGIELSLLAGGDPPVDQPNGLAFPPLT
jgi:hypothetical protein